MLTIDELLSTLEEQAARAKVDADIRAQTIVELQPLTAEALTYLIQTTAIQFYHRGAIDAMTREYPKRLRA